MKVKAAILRVGTDQLGLTLTKEALLGLVGRFKAGVPVLRDYSESLPIGKVLSLEFDETTQSVVAICEIDEAQIPAPITEVSIGYGVAGTGKCPKCGSTLNSEDAKHKCECGTPDSYHTVNNIEFVSCDLVNVGTLTHCNYLPKVEVIEEKK